jgi:hypothetical protein
LGRIRITAVIVSTRPMHVYGGVRISERDVSRFAEKMRRGEIPFGLHHDPRVNLDAEIVDVAVRRNPQGEVCAEVTIEVDEEEYVRKGGTQVGGFSVDATTTLLQSEGVEPVAVISADAHWFDDTQLTAAYAAFNERGISARANRLYQFADVSGAVVLLTFVGQQFATMPSNVICSYVYDSLKNLFSRKDRKDAGREPSDFAIKFDPATGRMVDLHIRTSSDDVLRGALDKLPGIIESNSKGRYEYIEGAQAWEIIE